MSESAALATTIIPLLWLRRELRHFSLHVAIPRQHAVKAGIERLRDLRPLLEPRQEQSRGLDGGEAVAARLLAELAVARRALRAQNHPLTLQHPRVAPPQRLGLAPGSVEQHDAFDVGEDGALVRLDLALRLIATISASVSRS